MKYICVFSILLSSYTSIAQKNVTFIINYSTSNHSKAKAVSFDYARNKFIFFESKIIKYSSKNEKFVISLNAPSDVSIFKHRFFLEPGQIYNIKIFAENDSIAVSGKNYGNYICWGLMEKNVPQIGIFSIYGGRELMLKQLLEIECKRKISILDSLRKLGVMSAGCHKYAYNETYYSYLGTLTLIRKQMLDSDSVNMRKIIADYKPSIFSDDRNLTSKFYAFALSNYVTDILVKRDQNEYSASHLERTVNVINDRFTGIQKEFLLSYIFRMYCRKQLPSYKSSIDSLFPIFLREFEKEIYVDVVLSWNEFYNKIDKQLPENILNAQLYVGLSDSIPFKSLIDNEKRNVVDFWASWCSPCIKQIKEYVNKKTLINLKVNVIFISIDEKASEHRIVSDRLRVQSYRLSSYSAAVFKKYFSIPPIPRTILIEKKLIRETDFDFYAFINRF